MEAPAISLFESGPQLTDTAYDGMVDLGHPWDVYLWEDSRVHDEATVRTERAQGCHSTSAYTAPRSANRRVFLLNCRPMGSQNTVPFLPSWWQQ